MGLSYIIPLPSRGKQISTECITLKGIYGRFRINLNNCEFTKFRDFASDFANWSQIRVKSVKLSKFFFQYNQYEIWIN